MKIFGLQINRSVKNIPEQEERGSLEDYLAYFGIPLSNNGSTVTYTTALNISAVYKAVNMISDSIAILPLEPYTIQDETLMVDKNHTSYSMLNVEPHPMYGKFNFWKTLVANTLLHGNGYGYIVRDKVGSPVNLILYYPPDVEIYVNEDNHQLKYKIIGKDGFIDPSDMIHIVNYSTNGYSGESAVTYGSRSLGIAIASDKTAKGFFDNGANASGIIKVDGRITPEKAVAIKNAWNTAFSPYNEDTTPGGVAVLEQGMEYQPVSVDPKSAQLLESRKWNVEEVARWFNLPGAKLGITTGLNYNSIEQLNIEYLQTTLMPFIEKIENELARKLYRPSMRSVVKAKFNEDAIIRTDLDSKITYLSKSVESGLLTINEARNKLGMPPIEGGNEILAKSGTQPLAKLLAPVEQDAPVEQNSLQDQDVEQSAPKRQRSKNNKEK